VGRADWWSELTEDFFGEGSLGVSLLMNDPNMGGFLAFSFFEDVQTTNPPRIDRCQFRIVVSDPGATRGSAPFARWWELQAGLEHDLQKRAFP